MLTLPRLPWLLAALLITAALHCACGHEVSIGSDGLPHKHCHNEFGCLCQGATLVASVDLEHSSSPIDILAPASEVLAADTWVGTLAFARDHFAAPPPLAGRALRAHFSSLVI